MSVSRLLKDPLVELQLERDVLVQELEEGVEKEVVEEGRRIWRWRKSKRRKQKKRKWKWRRRIIRRSESGVFRQGDTPSFLPAWGGSSWRRPCEGRTGACVWRSSSSC